MRGRQLWSYMFMLSPLRSGCATAQASDSAFSPDKPGEQIHQSLHKMYTSAFYELKRTKKTLYEHCEELNDKLPPAERLESPMRYPKTKYRPAGFKQRFIQLTILNHPNPLSIVTSLVNGHGHGTLEALGELFCSLNATRRGLCLEPLLNTASKLVKTRIDVNIDSPYELIRNFLLREFSLIEMQDFSTYIANAPERHSPGDLFLYMLRKGGANAPALHALYSQILVYLIERENLVHSNSPFPLNFAKSVLDKAKLIQKYGSRIFRSITLENIVSIKGTVFHSCLSISNFFVAGIEEIFRYVATSDSKKISPYFVTNYMNHYLNIYDWPELSLLASALEGFFSNALHGRERLEITFADSSLVYSLLSGPVCKMLDHCKLLSAPRNAPYEYICIFLAELPIGTSVEVLDIAQTNNDQKLIEYIRTYRFAAYAVWEAMRVEHEKDRTQRAAVAHEAAVHHIDRCSVLTK
ncbi:hypothetical protein PAPHI01_0252 [Pancytospora philotis]|nr:hypothetical protein PAPHI01_0252 [Pancytospora philotis]